MYIRLGVSALYINQLIGGLTIPNSISSTLIIAVGMHLALEMEPVGSTMH